MTDRTERNRMPAPRCRHGYLAVLLASDRGPGWRRAVAPEACRAGCTPGEELLHASRPEWQAQ